MQAKFNSSIYSKSALVAAIGAFKELAELSLEQSQDGYVVSLVNLLDTDPDVEKRLFDEFGNYALYQTIAEKKQWR